MNLWKRWLHTPRTLGLRRILFQIHLWIGLAIGLYIVMLSLTGSALVFRRELVVILGPGVVGTDPAARVLSPEELRAAGQRAYPGYDITRVGNVQRRSVVAELSLAKDGEEIYRVFNAYTGEDLGDPFPAGLRRLTWLADLHDDLLMGRGLGRWWNGIGSLLVTALCVTGAFVWWPGVNGWRRAMSVRWRSRWPSFSFDVHSALGFWGFVMLAIWAVSGVYLCFPGPFIAAVDVIWGTDATYGARPGDVVLEWLVRLHFGRWPSHVLKTVWVVIGLMPAVMFVTGGVMWWNRVVRRRRERARAVVSLVAEPQALE